MEAVVAEREAKGMKEIAIQEKDLTLQWRGNTGKLVKVRLKNTCNGNVVQQTNYRRKHSRDHHVEYY